MFPDDAELIRAYRNGEAEAFEALVRKYERPLFTFLLRLVGNRQSAEDLFQDTFLRVLRALPKYKEDGRFSGWLFGIANNLAVDLLRRHGDLSFKEIAELQRLKDTLVQRQKNRVDIIERRIQQLTGEAGAMEWE